MSLRKKVISVLTATGCMLNFAAMGTVSTAIAQTASDEFNYGEYLTYTNVDEDDDGVYDYVEITGCDQSVTEVEIPAAIDGVSVKSIGNSAFRECSITNVKIPESVINIGDGAFSYCYFLEEIDLPDNLATIGNSALSGCIALKSLTIPGSVETIDSYILDGTNVTEVVIEDGVRNIGEYAFMNLPITGITIPDSVTTIGNYAFWFAGITSVAIPDSVTTIGEGAFSDCQNLEEVTIGSGIQKLGKYAFDNTLWLQNRQNENPFVIENNMLIDGKNALAI